MEIIRIIPSDNKLWEQVWRIYTESFPEPQRRRISSHTRAVEDPAFHTYIAVDNGTLLGLLFYWNYDDKIFIEHLAIEPSRQGQNIGSTIMREFMEDHRQATIILEIDPPQGDLSRDRLRFYERLGFRQTGFGYTHPSYRKKGEPHELEIMSWPEALSAKEFEEFMEFIFSRVMTYTD